MARPRIHRLPVEDPGYRDFEVIGVYGDSKLFSVDPDGDLVHGAVCLAKPRSSGKLSPAAENLFDRMAREEAARVRRERNQARGYERGNPPD